MKTPLRKQISYAKFNRIRDKCCCSKHVPLYLWLSELPTEFRVKFDLRPNELEFLMGYEENDYFYFQHPITEKCYRVALEEDELQIRVSNRSKVNVINWTLIEAYSLLRKLSPIFVVAPKSILLRDDNKHYRRFLSSRFSTVKRLNPLAAKQIYPFIKPTIDNGIVFYCSLKSFIKRILRKGHELV